MSICVKIPPVVADACTTQAGPDILTPRGGLDAASASAISPSEKSKLIDLRVLMRANAQTERLGGAEFDPVIGSARCFCNSLSLIHPSQLKKAATANDDVSQPTSAL